MWVWGVKQLRTVLVFHDKDALNTFITKGYMVGADANGAAKYDDNGIAPIGASANGVAKEYLFAAVKSQRL